MFVYPETMQTDAIEDFLEADSLQQHLDVMFASDAPPLHWDEERHYTRSRLELYYLSHAAKPLHLEQLTEVLLVHTMHAHKTYAPGLLLRLKLLSACWAVKSVVHSSQLQMAVVGQAMYRHYL